jgi:hexosaminidase
MDRISHTMTLRRHVTSVLCLLAPVLFVTSAVWAQQPHLIPMPREVHLATPAPLPSAIVLVPGNDVEDNNAADDLSDAMRARNIRVTPNTGTAVMTVSLLRDDTPSGKEALQSASMTIDAAMHDEGYVLVASPGHVNIVAQTASGIFYGVQTLKQMITGYGSSATLATGTVKDWPAMKYRGIDDDLSRGPFPTLAFQKQQIREFAAFKANVYSPYFEHTVQYAADPITSPQGSSLSRSEAQELVRYAARYHIMIIPEQEAFGHLHHILKYEKYSDLAESPHGHVLAPHADGTQPLILSWFKQLAEDYPSPFLHIGADETGELGAGRTKDEVQKRGLGPVYGDFLAKIHETLTPLHRKLLFWGDMATADPSAIPNLPKDMIAVPWIYWHLDNYDPNILPFKNAGIETWVAPGDSNWSQMYPLGDQAIDNISGFIESGQRLGSTGSLLTVWNDDGEGLFNQDWFGVLFGAAAAWQPGRSSGDPYKAGFGELFYGDTTGKVMQAQAELMAAIKNFDGNDTTFWVDPWSKAGEVKAIKLRPVLHDTRMHAERALSLLAEARVENDYLLHPEAIAGMELGARRIDLAAMKFQLADEIADGYKQAYARRSVTDKKEQREIRSHLSVCQGNNGRCADLRDAYSAIKNLYKEAWLAENRPYWLDNVLVRYDMQIQLWQQRNLNFGTIASDWQKTHELPTPDSLGMVNDPVAVTPAKKKK